MARKPPRNRNRKKAVARPRVGGRLRAKPGRGRIVRPATKRTKRVAGATHARGRPPAKKATARSAARTRARRPAPRAGARRRLTPPAPERVAATMGILARLYPEAHSALDFETPLQLLVATILSAQCTDKRVNLVTPGLFARYPDAAALASADPTELENVIRSTGFYRNKARALRECSADIVATHGGQVPADLEALTALRGVGRKTANVVLGNAFGIPGVVVDTHVTRLANRLGFTNESDPVKIEFALMDIVPRERWTIFSHWLILHGRAVCAARTPKCSVCTLAPHCPRVGVTAAS